MAANQAPPQAALPGFQDTRVDVAIMTGIQGADRIIARGVSFQGLALALGPDGDGTPRQLRAAAPGQALRIVMLAAEHPATASAWEDDPHAQADRSQRLWECLTTIALGKVPQVPLSAVSSLKPGACHESWPCSIVVLCSCVTARHGVPPSTGRPRVLVHVQCMYTCIY